MSVMEPPVLNIPGELTFTFQAGILKELISVNIGDFTFEKLKELACNFLDKKVDFCFKFHNL